MKFISEYEDIKIQLDIDDTFCSTEKEKRYLQCDLDIVVSNIFNNRSRNFPILLVPDRIDNVIKD